MLLDILYYYLPMLLFGIGLVTLIVFSRKDNAGFWDTVCVGFMCSFLFCVSYAVISIIVGNMIITIYQTKEIVKHEQEVVSLRSTENVSGSFVLGSGSIGSKSYYIFYIKTEDGGYLQKKVNAYNVVLHESDKTTPKYTEVKEYIRCDNPLIVPKHAKFTLMSRIMCDRRNRTLTRSLIVPENTIIKEFKLE